MKEEYTEKLDKKGEVWKQVPDYPRYYISNLGRIRRDGYLNHQRNLRNPRLLKLRNDDETRIIQVHRLVAELFIPNTDAKKTIVYHKNKQFGDNRVENLVWRYLGQSVSETAVKRNKNKKELEAFYYESDKSYNKKLRNYTDEQMKIVTSHMKENADERKSNSPRMIVENFRETIKTMEKKLEENENLTRNKRHDNPS